MVGLQYWVRAVALARIHIHLKNHVAYDVEAIQDILNINFRHRWAKFRKTQHPLLQPYVSVGGELVANINFVAKSFISIVGNKTSKPDELFDGFFLYF